MSKISDVKAIQVFDSRGIPTISCKITLENKISASAMVPSGASTGSKEALELRDNDLIYTGDSSSYYITITHNTSTYRANAVTLRVHVNLTFLDEGATGTSHTYFLGISGNNGVVRVDSASHNAPYVCILQEISK